MKQKANDFDNRPKYIIFEERAYDLTRDNGQIGAMLFCEEMIQEKQKQINEMEFCDKERISALRDSMMDWGAIRSRVEKGFVEFTNPTQE